MKISIQQPECFPWLGYFDKILQVDKVVFLDNVQFKKRYFENRNKIRTRQGWVWLSVPVKTKGRYTQLIRDVEIDNSQQWQRKIVSALEHSYKKTRYWNDFGSQLCDFVSRPYHYLLDFNMAIIEACMQRLGIEREWCMASSLQTKQVGSYLILEICQKMCASDYLSGAFGRDYLKENDFHTNNINVHYQNFNHPVYEQIHGKFEPAMSIIDLYFNHGSESMNILKNNLKTRWKNHEISQNK
ncbi:MAG: WbqC family protein [Planctomycetes bacterium]|nr:WbqC family protein [Planctomycetota bacterium]